MGVKQSCTDTGNHSDVLSGGSPSVEKWVGMIGQTCSILNVGNSQCNLMAGKRQNIIKDRIIE